MTQQLIIDGVRASYGKKEVLRGVSLSLGSELVALIGPNGAGKSTLLRVISGFLLPAAGRVLIGGRDVTADAPHLKVAAGLGYFMQGGRVFPNLSAAENLEVSLAALPASAGRDAMATVLDLLPGLGSVLGRRAGLLSGGERQYLALAMVLVKRPRLLLLDEPSAGLSPRLAAEFLANIREITYAWKLSTLLVEQNIGMALRVAHRAVALVRGAVAADTARPADWLADGYLERFFLDHRPEAAGLVV